VCGAYESVAAGKPMILSRTKALMSYFFMGAIYTENSCFSMVKAIETIVNKMDLLSREIAQLKMNLVRDWDQKKLRLERILRSY
jgi:predicted translin family RNA/ssDNA-binding protein